MGKNEDRISKADLARLSGKTPQAVGKQLRAHGVTAGKDGKVSKRAALEAMAAGAALDKNRAEGEMEKIKAGGNTESLVIKGKMATLRRIILQGDLLEIERDKARGDLVPQDTYKSGLVAMQNVCLRLWDVWIESIGAKRKDAALIEELRRGRDQVLEETAAILEDATL